MNLNNGIEGGVNELKSPKIIISDEIRKVAPNLVIGAIYADVIVEKRNEELWLRLNELGDNIKIRVEEIVEQPNIVSIRETYLKCGKKPAKYRGSAEALLRRVAQGKGLYQINTVVDINNYLSLNTLVPAGSYDLTNIDGDITIGIGKTGESYKGIGKDIINIENLPVFSDNKGPFGSPTSDSERAMITGNTKRMLIMLISFGGNLDGNLRKYLEEGSELISTYASGKNIEIKQY
ncbi:MAG: phenylalanine--tRNA ligase beta subunit-related protein [Candidatus Gracilibacteria bacterium]|nr:phenylalanine--tRNA ligase beta subunit-related protein [Candidatus Gracilibacteria bacterium]